MATTSIVYCYVIVLLLFIFCLEVDSYKVGSRSILRVINDGTDLPDAAVDLNTTNFESVLKDTPASFAIVEFFAHWCPACRNYKPQYERVARLFNGREAVHPGTILMARVDCAEKINTKLCDQYSVTYYPMLLWGPPSKFVSGGAEAKQKGEIVAIDDGRTADRLLNWINKHMSSNYNLDDEKYENEHLIVNMSDHKQIVRAVYDVEEATSSAFDIILGSKVVNSKTRPSLKGFLQLLVAHHPSRRCRKGSADILVNFDEFWPSDLSSSNKQEAIVSRGKDAVQVCGKEVPRGYWIYCRGSKNETRGFSCLIFDCCMHTHTTLYEKQASFSISLVFAKQIQYFHVKVPYFRRKFIGKDQRHPLTSHSAFIDVFSCQLSQ
ncbi:hypothetical protein MKW94_016453, partial [Papaver nudicaule]|nr:hypothetical protein [Papaver nudicaule]